MRIVFFFFLAGLLLDVLLLDKRDMEVEEGRTVVLERLVVEGIPIGELYSWPIVTIEARRFNLKDPFPPPGAPTPNSFV